MTMQMTIKANNESTDLSIVKESIAGIDSAIHKLEDDIINFREKGMYGKAINLCNYKTGLEIAKRNIIASMKNHRINT